LLLIQRTEVGHIELNWSWLPTWIGMNTALLREIEAAVSPMVVGRALTDDLLEEIHQLVIDFLKQKYVNISGIDDYLDGLKFVTMQA
jgi:hypothetical protein